MDIFISLVVAGVTMLFATMAVTPMIAERQPDSRRRRRSMAAVPAPESPVAPDDRPLAA